MASPSSSASLSPIHSPTLAPDAQPADFTISEPLPHLVTHLIAAKRSLSATAHVERANTLAATARRNIEAIAALSARRGFLQKYVQRELRLLDGIRRRLEAVTEKGGGEFKAVLRTLDACDARVKQTLHLLKTTLVEPSLQAAREEDADLDAATTSTASTGTGPADETTGPSADNVVTKRQKSLYDFVSERGVDDLTQVFRQCIDATSDATNGFAASNEAFDAELQNISDVLSSSSASLHGQLGLSRPSEDDRNSGSDLDDPNSTTASLFRSLESHATEMATLLQSLVRHYDLCVTALKHTEGGGEAAAQAQAQAQVEIPGGLAHLDRDTPHEPISEDERAEMMAVLEKDALEVEDVVQEIRDRAAEMEDQLNVLSNRVAVLKTEHMGLNTAVRMLDDLGRNLPIYIQASASFLNRWAEQKARIEQNMEELEAMRDFYDGFLRAYDGLILEIGRRKAVQIKMEKILSEAMTKVSKLYDEDAEEREAFKHEQGDYIPADLWPGLVHPPAKFELRRVDEGTIGLPDVSKEAMQRAMQRNGKRL